MFSLLYLLSDSVQMTEPCKKGNVIIISYCCHNWNNNDCILTLSGEPLISTLSANLTRLGFDLSFAFFAADRRADFRLELWGTK